MDSADGIVWYGRGQGWLGVSERFLEVVTHRDHPKGTLAQPTPRGWYFQDQVWLSPPGPPVMGLLWSCSFSSANASGKQEEAQG